MVIVTSLKQYISKSRTRRQTSWGRLVALPSGVVWWHSYQVSLLKNFIILWGLPPIFGVVTSKPIRLRHLIFFKQPSSDQLWILSESIDFSKMLLNFFPKERAAEGMDHEDPSLFIINNAKWWRSTRWTKKIWSKPLLDCNFKRVRAILPLISKYSSR